MDLPAQLPTVELIWPPAALADSIALPPKEDTWPRADLSELWAVPMALENHPCPALRALPPHLPISPVAELSAPCAEAIAFLASDAALVSHPRHQDVLRRAVEHVEEAIAARRAGLPTDLMSIDLTAAVNVLGEITGETVSETLLETIFGRFCVGK